MGIQINGQTDTVTSTTAGGRVTVTPASFPSVNNINATGLSTFSGGLLVGTGVSISSPAGGALALGTNNTEAVRIDSSGRVGVGTINLPSKLCVTQVGSSYSTSEVDLHAIAVSSGNNGRTMWMGYDDVMDAGYINAAKSGSSRPIYLQTRNLTNATTVFVGIGTTQPTGTINQYLQVGGGAHVLGNLGVGATSPSYLLDVNGQARFQNHSGNGSTLGNTSGFPVLYTSTEGGRTYETHNYNSYPTLYSSIFINPTGSTNIPASFTGNGYRFVMGGGDTGGRGFDLLGSSDGLLYFRPRETGTWQKCTTTTPSDYRLKKDISPMKNASERILKTNPVEFTYIKDDKKSEGFIAHELQEIFPDVVLGEKDGHDDDGNEQHQSIEYQKMIPYLTSALKEALLEIKKLQKDFEDYKNTHP